MEVFPNWTAIPIVVFILTLVFILNRTFFRPLGKTLEERHRRIEGAREEAEQIRAASEQRLHEFDKRMREARHEADLHMASIMNSALSEKGSVISRKKAETEKMLNEAREDIRTKTEEARRTLQHQSELFSYRIASQILRRPVQRKRSPQT